MHGRELTPSSAVRSTVVWAEAAAPSATAVVWCRDRGDVLGAKVHQVWAYPALKRESGKAEEAPQRFIQYWKEVHVRRGRALNLVARHREDVAALPRETRVARHCLAAPLDAAEIRLAVERFGRLGGQGRCSTVLSLQGAKDRFGALHCWMTGWLTDDQPIPESSALCSRRGIRKPRLPLSNLGLKRDGLAFYEAIIDRRGAENGGARSNSFL